MVSMHAQKKEKEEQVEAKVWKQLEKTMEMG